MSIKLLVAVVVVASVDAAMRADLEVVKLWSKSGDGTFTLLYSDFSANIMGGGAFNNICAWDVCRGNRQGLKFSNGEPLWESGGGTNIGSFQVMAKQHRIKFTKFCARSYDYDPDSETWWLSKAFSNDNGKVTENDVGYIEIDGLHDFCAVKDVDATGGSVGRTPSPVRVQVIPEKDRLIPSLKKIEQNIRSVAQFTPEFEKQTAAELGDIKKRAAASGPAMEKSIVPMMKRIHGIIMHRKAGIDPMDVDAEESVNINADGSTQRRGTRSVKSNRQSKRSAMIAAVLGAVVVVFAGSVLLPLVSGGEPARAPAKKTKKAEKTKNKK
eukprot:m.1637806 g.1637806  ORF g.1637806 m.1637806 type:complete len:326 (+) comp26216_c0_seq1:139-1116(+)